MRRIRVDLGPRGYDIVVGTGILPRAAAMVRRRARVAVVSQSEVVEAWGWPLAAALQAAGADVQIFLMDNGEAAKSLSTVESLCRRFATWGLLRNDAIVALGGGVVGDTAGYAAASYHRGVAYVQVPTTLLGQVDAAIGGKTGVNLPEGKNLVGAFHQPIGVVADVATLATLAEREYRAGLGEVVKYAFMGDEDLRRTLEDPKSAAALVARETTVVEEVVGRCVALKAAVVSADEQERTGLRATLNYGHTLAHALETGGDYGLLHGEAVAVGLVFATELAAAIGRVEPAEVTRARNMLVGLGLPTLAPAGIAGDDLIALMRRDKKASGGLTFVLPGPNGLEQIEDPPAHLVWRSLAAVGVTG